MPNYKMASVVGAMTCGLHEYNIIFQVNLGQPVPIEAKDNGGGSDNWSYKSCKAPAKSSPPTNQHPVFLQTGCPSCCPTNSVKALNGKYHITWTYLPHPINSSWLPWGGLTCLSSALSDACTTVLRKSHNHPIKTHGQHLQQSICCRILII